MRNLRNARQLGDFVIVAAHIHQSQSTLEMQHLSTRPPAFYIELAHRAIDTGADAFVGSGIQTLRGIEIYRGKPIFYGLGEVSHLRLIRHRRMVVTTLAAQAL